jgi:hypothetical protein
MTTPRQSVLFVCLHDLPAVSEDFAKTRDAIVARVTALLDSAVPPR